MNNIIANTIKYKIDKFIIVIGDEYITIVPENISSFIIYNDYTNAIIPLIKVTFVTSATNISQSSILEKIVSTISGEP